MLCILPFLEMGHLSLPFGHHSERKGSGQGQLDRA